MKKYIPLVLLFGVAGAVLYMFPFSFTAQPVRTVTVVGTAQTQKTNKMAQFSAGVNAVNDDKQKAIDEVNTKVSEVIAQVKKFGVSSKDVKTQNLNIYQNQEQYYEDGRQKQRLGQWNVSNTIEITLRDVARVNEFTDMLSQTGANNVYGPNFSLDQPDSSDTQLLKAAYDDAQKKASALAGLGKARLGKLITLTEGAAPGVEPIITYEKGMGGGGGADTQVGSTTVSKSVTATFELR